MATRPGRTRLGKRSSGAGKRNVLRQGRKRGCLVMPGRARGQRDRRCRALVQDKWHVRTPGGHVTRMPGTASAEQPFRNPAGGEGAGCGQMARSDIQIRIPVTCSWRSREEVHRAERRQAGCGRARRGDGVGLLRVSRRKLPPSLQPVEPGNPLPGREDGSARIRRVQHDRLDGSRGADAPPEFNDWASTAIRIPTTRNPARWTPGHWLNVDLAGRGARCERIARRFVNMGWRRREKQLLWKHHFLIVRI